MSVLIMECPCCGGKFEIGKNLSVMPTRNPTNADRIRAMTDEELAEFLFNAWNNAAWCSEKDCPDEESCFPCWINWLKQEVET